MLENATARLAQLARVVGQRFVSELVEHRRERAPESVATAHYLPGGSADWSAMDLAEHPQSGDTGRAGAPGPCPRRRLLMTLGGQADVCDVARRRHFALFVYFGDSGGSSGWWSALMCCSRGPMVAEPPQIRAQRSSTLRTVPPLIMRSRTMRGGARGPGGRIAAFRSQRSALVKNRSMPLGIPDARREGSTCCRDVLQ